MRIGKMVMYTKYIQQIKNYRYISDKDRRAIVRCECTVLYIHTRVELSTTKNKFNNIEHGSHHNSLNQIV